MFKDMWHHQIWGQYAGYAAGYAASSVLMPASVYILMLCLLYRLGLLTLSKKSQYCFYNINFLVVVPAYGVKEVSTAFTVLIPLSYYACFYCQRSLNCFYNAYTV